jgi:hypothetical protein
MIYRVANQTLKKLSYVMDCYLVSFDPKKLRANGSRDRAPPFYVSTYIRFAERVVAFLSSEDQKFDLAESEIVNEYVLEQDCRKNSRARVA